MKAAVLSAPGVMSIREIADPVVGPRDVVVRVTGVGLCGTDFHIYEGHANYHTDRLGRPIPFDVSPQVLGHEVAGVVEAMGSEVRDLSAGDAVVLDQGRNCLSAGTAALCEYCATGDSHQCETYAEHGITGWQGGLAEVLVMPAVNAVRRGHALPAEHAALTEPLACILHAHAAVRRGRDVARYRLQDADPSARVQTVVHRRRRPCRPAVPAAPPPGRRLRGPHRRQRTERHPAGTGAPLRRRRRDRSRRDRCGRCDADADRRPPRRVPDRRLGQCPGVPADAGPDPEAGDGAALRAWPVRRRPRACSTR